MSSIFTLFRINFIIILARILLLSESSSVNGEEEEDFGRQRTGEIEREVCHAHFLLDSVHGRDELSVVASVQSFGASV